MPTAEAAGQRRPPRGRRRLRTRIIVTITLLGFCLTALFAYSTTLLRTRVENQLLSDALNRNIDAYASAFERDPTNATFAFEGVQGWVYANERLANAPADWRGLRDGIHELHGVEENGQAFAYKLAVRRTPTHAFFLAYGGLHWGYREIVSLPLGVRREFVEALERQLEHEQELAGRH